MGQFKIGIIADMLRMPFAESMEQCARMGADGVQIYAVSEEMLSASEEELKRRKKIIQDNGLQISALCGDLGGHGFARRDENVKKVQTSKHIIDMALTMGCNIVTTHIGVIPEDTRSDVYRTMQEACGELAEYAAGVGAFFAIETGPEPSERLCRFLDSLGGSKGMSVNLDPANLVMVAGDDPVKAVHYLSKYIVHTHAKDGVMLKKTDPQIVYDFFAEGGIGDLRLEDYFLEVPLGEGKVDFPAYLGALKEIGFGGYLTIEREVGENPVQDIGKAVTFLRNLI
ncbi:sugar phosphate isomerase/epimerase [bacterium D16-50]|nr:sugar phosphate isomerase/epimerase [bacterium D16-50]